MTYNLESILDNTTTIIPDYIVLNKGSYLANIPIIRDNRGAPVIRNLSLEGQTDHGEALRNVLTYETIDSKVRSAFEQGDFRFNLANGFHGNGFGSLDEHTKAFLKRWESGYLQAYKQYRHNLDAHDEIKNYRHVMLGALKGVSAGAVVGASLDGASCLLDSHGIYWEIGARSLPAILEAEEIARPFFERLKEWTAYKSGKSDKKPEPFTPTEVWSLTQLAGPIIGIGMLVVGEKTGLNQNPFYRATAVFTINTGNNVIGAGSTYAHFFRDVRRTRFNDDNFFYLSYRPETTTWTDIRANLKNAILQVNIPFFRYIVDFNNALLDISDKLRDKTKNSVYHLAQKHKSVRALVNAGGDAYLAACNFWADSFQSSNVKVALSWYGAEVGLRYFGIAAENLKFSGCFGGKTLAAIESGLLSCDTAAAAKVAIEKEKKNLHNEVRKLTDKFYLSKLYAS